MSESRKFPPLKLARQSMLSRSSALDESGKRVVAVLTGTAVANKVYEALKAVCENLQAILTHYTFTEFDFGAADVLEAFYSADVVVTDLTERNTRQPLLYQLGVRASLHNAESILTITETDPETLIQLRCVPDYEVIPFRMFQEECIVVQDSEIDSFDDPHGVSLREQFEDSIRRIEKRTVSMKKAELMEAIRQKCEIKDEANRLRELQIFETELLKSSSYISTEIILTLALSYRDLQEYDAIISLISRYESHSELSLEKDDPAEDVESKKKRMAKIAIKVQLATAYNRRNKNDDRQKALSILLKEVVNNAKHRVPDNQCLVGRIYKDMFLESDYKDTQSLQEAIKWYRMAFQMQQSEFAGINLATLLVVSGESFENNDELQRIGITMNNSLGRKGSIDKLKDYWTVATVFEMSILTETYPQAIRAASCMYNLRAPTWHLKSTMNNIKLIQTNRKPCETSSSVTKLFRFWLELFNAICLEKEASDNIMIPVLLAEPLERSTDVVYQPCRILANKDAQEVHLFNVTYDSSDSEQLHLLNSVGVHLPNVDAEWKFLASNIRRVAPHPNDKLCLFLYVDSSDFQLLFASEHQRNGFIELVNGFVPTKRDSMLSPVFTDEDFNFEYETDDKGSKIRLGKGSFGTVYSVRTVTNKTVAMKEVPIVYDKDLQPLIDEINLQKRWHHPNIVEFYGANYDKQNKTFRIFMEQVPGGSLSDLLRKQWGPLLKGEDIMSSYTRQLLSGIAYLHDQCIVHRDIKGDNVLVNKFTGVLKLSDFGTSKRLERINPRIEGEAGTYQYMAPEVINSQRGYGLPADIWSLGCTVVEMATGQRPFHEFHYAQTVFKVGSFRTHPEIPSELSDSCKNFLSCCFKPEAKDRSTAKELLKHAWIVDVVLRSSTSQPISNHSSISSLNSLSPAVSESQLHASSSSLSSPSQSSHNTNTSSSSASKHTRLEVPRFSKLNSHNSINEDDANSDAESVDSTDLRQRGFHRSFSASPETSKKISHRHGSTHHSSNNNNNNNNNHNHHNNNNSNNHHRSPRKYSSPDTFVVPSSLDSALGDSKKQEEMLDFLHGHLSEKESDVVKRWMERVLGAAQSSENVMFARQPSSKPLDANFYLKLHLQLCDHAFTNKAEISLGWLSRHKDALPSVLLALIHYKDSLKDFIRPLVAPHLMFFVDARIDAAVKLYRVPLEERMSTLGSHRPSPMLQRAHTAPSSQSPITSSFTATRDLPSSRRPTLEYTLSMESALSSGTDEGPQKFNDHDFSRLQKVLDEAAHDMRYTITAIFEQTRDLVETFSSLSRSLKDSLSGIPPLPSHLLHHPTQPFSPITPQTLVPTSPLPPSPSHPSHNHLSGPHGAVYSHSMASSPLHNNQENAAHLHQADSFFPSSNLDSNLPLSSPVSTPLIFESSSKPSSPSLNDLPSAGILTFTSTEELLRSLSIPQQIIDNFIEQEVTLDLLPLMEKDDLSLIVPVIGPRIKIWNAIKKMNKS